MTLTGNPEKGPQASRTLKAKAQKHGPDIVGALLIMVIDLLVGMQAFSYFSNRYIAGGITLVVLWILYKASSTAIRIEKMEKTRLEAEREHERYWEGKIKKPKSIVFALPVGSQNTWRRALTVFWTVVI